MSSEKPSDASGRQQLLGNVLSGWMTQFLTVITGFLVPRIMDEQLGQAMVGIWDLSWSVVSYLNLGHLGLASSLNRFVANYRADGDIHSLRVATSTSAIIQTITATVVLVVASVVAITLPILMPDLGEQTFVAQCVILILGGNLAISFLFETSRNVLNGCHRWDVSNNIYAATNLLACAMIIGSLLAGYGLVAASLAYASTTLLEGLVRWHYMRRICPEAQFRLSLSSMSFARELFRFGITAFLMGLMPVFILSGTNLLIASTLGVQFLAIFARPNAILRFIGTLVTRFTFILTPMAGPILKREGKESLENFLISCSRYGLAFSLPILTMFCLFGDDVIRFWMGEHYVQYPVILILGIGALLPLSQSAISRILLGLNYHGRIYVQAVLFGALVFTAGLPVVFIAGVSMEAYAILAVTTQSLMSGVFIPYFACRKLELSVRRYVAQSYFLVLTLWAIATIPLLLSIFLVNATSIVFDAFVSVAYGVVLSILYWQYLLPPDARDKVREKLIKWRLLKPV